MNKSFKYILAIILFAFLFIMQGCTCCVYYNHMFNTKRAFNEAKELQQARSDTLSIDSVLVTKAEKEKLDKTIKKGSAILERYPDDEKHKPLAVFFIGEAFRMQGNYPKAIVKYNEFEKYFPKHDSINTVQYQRAYCYYKRNEYATARFALEPIIEKGETHPWYPQALELLSEIDENQLTPKAAIATLEKLLVSKNIDDYMKAKAHYKLAKLYFIEEEYIKAKAHFGVNIISLLPLVDQYDAAYMSAECSIITEGYQQAAVELDTLIKNKKYTSYKTKTQIRYAETLLLMKQEDKAYKTLKQVIRDSTAKKEVSHAWFIMGDHEQTIRGDYPIAINYYDSCKTANKYSKWSKIARERIESLKKYLSYAKKKNSKVHSKTIKPEEDFMIAELFLFKLDEIDSALVKLEHILATNDKKSDLSAQASYAQAYIYDEYKKDKSKADSIYQYVIENYPNSEYAKQSQVILGLPVTVKTSENFAYEAFVVAENVFDSISNVSVDSIALIDSLYGAALTKYDSVHVLYPGTEYAAKALYAKAWIFEEHEASAEKARFEYEILAKEYPRTIYGQKAKEKLDPKMKYNSKQLKDTRNLIEKQKALAKQKEETAKKAKKKVPKEIKEDKQEVLSDDYEDLYDF